MTRKSTRYGRVAPWTALAWLLAAVLLAPSVAEAGHRKKKKKKSTGKTAALPAAKQAKSPEHGLDFWYYVPSTYKGRKRVPLVLSYHGAGGTGKGEIRQWQKLAEQYGFIVACPTSRLAGAGQRAGVPRRVTPQEFFTEAEAALSIVRMLQEKYKINRRLVMATGFSGGGNPSYWLGFVHGDVFPFLCTRCGNFPMTLALLASRKPEIGQAVKRTAQTGHIFVFWGEKDHPIIRAEIPNTLKWLQSLNCADLSCKRIPGMGHCSRAAMAAAWFMEKAREVMEKEKKEAAVKHAQLLAAAKDACGKKDYATAGRQYRAAAELEECFPSLGRKGRSGVKRVNFLADIAWRRLKSSLRAKSDAERERAVREFAARFPDTKAAAKALQSLQPKEK